ncbi:MAG TPA: type II CAAX endopeptidase family protein [Thermoanaerobaculia bacterium]|nr:type II CAAX endopeptidase family protein [Thermoanaerobaculia bacterium]
MIRAAWVFYLLLGLAGLVWIGTREELIPLALFVDAGGWWIDLGLGVAAGGALLGLWWLLARFLPAGRELERRIAELLGPLATDEAIALAFLSGVAEELFFRGAVQGSWGWLWATVLFAVLHTGPGLSFRLWTLFAIVAGGLFGGLLEWRGNLLAPIVAHFVVNAVNLSRLAGGGRRAGAAEGDRGSLRANERADDDAA